MSEKGGNSVPVFVCGQIYNCALLLVVVAVWYIRDVSGNAGEQQVIYMSASSWLHVLTLPNASCPTQPTGQVVVAALPLLLLAVFVVFAVIGAE